MNPIILYNNLLALSPLTLTTVTGEPAETAEGYDLRNVVDPRTFTFWRGRTSGTYYITASGTTARTADAVAIENHNLGSIGATIGVEKSDDGGNWYTRLPQKPVQSDSTLMHVFPDVSAKHWRLKIVAPDGEPQLAVAFLGKRLDFPQPPETPYVPFRESAKSSTQRSQGGHVLGTDISYRSIEVAPRFRTLSREFVFGDFTAFWTAHGRLMKQFFWAWDLDYYPDQVFYLKIKDNDPFDPSVSVLSYVDELGFAMEGTRL